MTTLATILADANTAAQRRAGQSARLPSPSTHTHSGDATMKLRTYLIGIARAGGSTALSGHAATYTASDSPRGVLCVDHDGSRYFYGGLAEHSRRALRIAIFQAFEGMNGMRLTGKWPVYTVEAIS